MKRVDTLLHGFGSNLVDGGSSAQVVGSRPGWSAVNTKVNSILPPLGLSRIQTVFSG